MFEKEVPLGVAFKSKNKVSEQRQRLDYHTIFRGNYFGFSDTF